MSGLLKKLQYTNQPSIHVRSAPREFADELASFRTVATVSTAANDRKKAGFALFFVKSVSEIERFAPVAARKIEEDGVLWFAYPKTASKRYTTDISRDRGWQSLGDLDFEAVRQVAIDEDWSALRFRPVDRIPVLKRDPRMAMTEKGRRRASNRS